MDPRSNKPRDFVAIIKNMREEIQKIGHTQKKWLQRYEWLLDEYAKLKKEVKDLQEEKCSVETEFPTQDKRSCLPAPVTTNSDYGWLAGKAEFCLEKYGAYNPEYPNPLRDVTPLSGNIPMLAVGKGFIR